MHARTERVSPRTVPPAARPLSIAVCLSSLGLRRGGLETTLARLAAGLVERGHRVTLVTGERPGDAALAGARRLRVRCVDWTAAFWRPVRGRRPGWPLLAQSLTFLAGCRVHADTRRAIAGADVSLTALEAETIGISRWRARRGRANVSLFPGVIDAGRIVRDRSAVRLAVSRALAQRAIAAGGPAVDDVLLAGPPADWSTLPYDVRPAARTLLFVGRLEPNKGVDRLLDTFAALAPDLPELRLRIVGDGPLRGALERRIESADWGARVQLAGEVSEMRLRQEMASADLLVFPSRYESFSQAVLEAMAVGLPVVASDVEGNREAAGDAARLVPADDSAAWSAAVGSLLQDTAERRRLSRLGRARARQVGGDAVPRLEHWLHEAIARGPA